MDLESARNPTYRPSLFNWGMGAAMVSQRAHERTDSLAARRRQIQGQYRAQLKKEVWNCLSRKERKIVRKYQPDWAPEER